MKQKEAIPLVGLITTQLAKDVFITMKPRHQETEWKLFQ